MMRVACLIFSLTSVLPVATAAEVVVAARMIRAQSVILPDDLVVKQGELAGTANHLDLVVGQEARVALYEGRPIRLADIGSPAVIERNQIVPLIFERGGLHISAEGRSLSRAGPGDIVRVMNLSSRQTVSGRVEPDGKVIVSQ